MCGHPLKYKGGGNKLKKATIFFLALAFVVFLATACNHRPKDESSITDYILPVMPMIELKSDEGLLKDVSNDTVETNQTNLSHL